MGEEKGNSGDQRSAPKVPSQRCVKSSPEAGTGECLGDVSCRVGDQRGREA
jgi:hypothetical protein